VILDRIVESTRESLAERKARIPVSAVRGLAAEQGAPRNFADALRSRSISLIAEVKRASPSRGPLCPELSVSSLVSTYSQSGAAAISVLTEPHYFQGSLEDLDAARAAVDLPLLRKDFVIDPYQVYESRAHGADAVLLIAAILAPDELSLLLGAVHDLNMTALVEVHNRSELETALGLSPGVIGINNRNLLDFSVELETTLSLRPLIPRDVVVVSESGIHTRADVVLLENAGVDAILVGEALITSSDPAAKIDELLGHVAQESV
jgi:indole-3-glycerol phosphate synthase